MARNSIPQRESKGEYVVRRAQEILTTTGARGWSHAVKLAQQEYERLVEKR